MAFRDMPIQRKLTASLLVTSGAALALTSAAFVAYEVMTFRQTMRTQLATLGGVLAANSTAALAFGNQRDAAETLAALKAEPHVVAAALYDNAGRLFARYPATVAVDTLPSSPSGDGYHFEPSALVGFEAVAQDRNARLGTLFLNYYLRALTERFRLYAGIALGGAAASLLLAFALSTAFHRQIAEPILTLADMAHAVADRHDYSVRGTKRSNDELGVLTDAFNLMLARIDDQTRALKESDERLNLALTASGIGTWNWNLVDNTNTWDDHMFPLFGIEPSSFGARREDTLRLVHPDDRADVERAASDARRTNEPYAVQYRILRPDGDERVIASRGKVVQRDAAGAPIRMTGVCWDVTEEKRAEERLRALLAELARSNRELEQFAYVASHDLQEPLRMVSSYTQLLEKRYRDKLDDDAREFIHYAVDGARRMQRLINDLLEFSRVSTRGKPLERVDANEVLGAVRANLAAAIDETQALVTNGELPVIAADATQLGQLLQNLIGNAIKFHGVAAPRVHVSACDGAGEWTFSVKDNGIGIEREYFERIFVIFQRLHAGQQYPGTGIGLAVCKRIVERHGGRIWVESEPGTGTTFFFSIPKSPGARHV
jgi:PAS domain S-box-containing protein